MTDVRSYLHYFEQLAQQHIEINDFFVFDINEPLSALRNDIKYPALIMNTLSGGFTASNLDNILDEVKGGFLILGHLDSVDDFSGQMLLFQQMKQIGTDIIFRMNYDLIKCEPLAQKAIIGFNLQTVTYTMMDGILDNCFGFLFSFKVFSAIDNQYNVLKWQSTKPDPSRFQY